MKQRLYIDTSVFGGYFDIEFAEYTIPLFTRINNGEFTLLFSTITQVELENAPENIKNLVRSIKSVHTEFLEITAQTVDSATEYIMGKVVGKASYSDCLHIAAATVSRDDYLISWNFRHIVNVRRIRGCNSINLKNGYQLLEIRSPRDFIDYGDND